MCIYVNRALIGGATLFLNVIVPAMSLEESRRSQRPYRYGMVLLCVGALINWLGLAENYVEPVRYVGVACIIAGALLICAAMCCWLHAPPSRATMHTQHTNHPITAQVKYLAIPLMIATRKACGMLEFLRIAIHLPTGQVQECKDGTNHLAVRYSCYGTVEDGRVSFK
ncbi:uncharacterized protein LOC100648927 isoform X4 [Bombus terrestris]|uniref:Uncharacterized protein LOC100648927 isoform X4 n=1 Tax=Bombus terrestris TaxID=30195 RepID=A0A9C6T0B4_BOMTE|nr:uncharacterized protein LOC100648927 isoform X4 [Bombus terrestris]